MLPEEQLLWFVVQVMPQHEQSVALQLDLKGQEYFLPTIKSTRQWSDRKKLLTVPLFPGYVFCKTKRSWFGAVLNTQGVFRIVSFGGKAHPIPDDEMISLRRVIDSGRYLCPVPYVSLGKHVQVVRGPLSGMTGIVTRIKKQNRLVISVDLIMKSVSVDIAASELSLADLAS